MPKAKKDSASASASASATSATVGYESQLWRMADALRGSMDAAEYTRPEHLLGAARGALAAPEGASPPEHHWPARRRRHGRHRARNELLRECRAVSPEMALRLARLFGNSAEFWLSAQRAVDLWDAEQSAGRKVEQIKPLKVA